MSPRTGWSLFVKSPVRTRTKGYIPSSEESQNVSGIDRGTGLLHVTFHSSEEDYSPFTKVMISF